MNLPYWTIYNTHHNFSKVNQEKIFLVTQSTNIKRDEIKMMNIVNDNIFNLHNPIYQPLRSGRIWHKVNVLSGVLQVWIQSFPFPRLVASPRLKNSVCPTIYQ